MRLGFGFVKVSHNINCFTIHAYTNNVASAVSFAPRGARCMHAIYDDPVAHVRVSLVPSPIVFNVSEKRLGGHAFGTALKTSRNEAT